MKKERKERKWDLSEVLHYFISNNELGFFGAILVGLRIEKTKKVPSMAIAPHYDGQFQYKLIYNEDFVKRRNLEEIKSDLLHEVHHIILNHLPRTMRLLKKYEASGEEEVRRFLSVKPFSVDLATNDMLRHYDHTLVVPYADEFPTPGLGPAAQFPRGKTYEQYTYMLIDKLNDLDERLKEILKDALKLAQKSLGTSFSIPGESTGGEGDEGDESTGGEGDESTGGESTGGEGDESTGGEGDEGDDARKRSRQRLVEQIASAIVAESMGEEAKEKWAKDIEESQKKRRGKGEGTEDGAGEDNDPSDVMANNLEVETKALVKKAKTYIKSTGRGRIPGHLTEIIDGMLMESTVPWTDVLRGKVRGSRRSKYKRSIGRPRRRYLGIRSIPKFPGRSKDKTYHLCVIIDTSGSMSTNDLFDGLTEIKAMQKIDPGVKITVVEADVKINNVYEVRQHDELKPSLHGRGGTCFNLPIEEIRKRKIFPDAILYFTDGYAPPLKEENKLPIPFFWIITKNGKVPDKTYGEPIRMENYQ